MEQEGIRFPSLLTAQPAPKLTQNFLSRPGCAATRIWGQETRPSAHPAVVLAPKVGLGESPELAAALSPCPVYSFCTWCPPPRTALLFLLLPPPQNPNEVYHNVNYLNLRLPGLRAFRTPRGPKDGCRAEWRCCTYFFFKQTPNLCFFLTHIPGRGAAGDTGLDSGHPARPYNQGRGQQDPTEGKKPKFWASWGEILLI